jgi:hypothetical protein
MHSRIKSATSLPRRRCKPAIAPAILALGSDNKYLYTGPSAPLMCRESGLVLTLETADVHRTTGGSRARKDD